MRGSLPKLKFESAIIMTYINVDGCDHMVKVSIIY